MNTIIKFLISMNVILMGGAVWAASVTIPNTFVSGTPARAGEVNSNFAAVKSAVDDNDSRIMQLEAEVLNNINEILLNQYVPFKVEVAGGICNTSAIGSANPHIYIDSDGDSGTFLVNSILVKTNDVPASGFMYLSLNKITIDGTAYDTITANLAGNADGAGVLESFDILGTPVRLTSDLNDHTGGGNVPHQIVADSSDAIDINIMLFCRSNVTDMHINSVLVSGWKRVGDVISVTYVAGK